MVRSTVGETHVPIIETVKKQAHTPTRRRSRSRSRFYDPSPDRSEALTGLAEGWAIDRAEERTLSRSPEHQTRDRSGALAGPAEERTEAEPVLSESLGEAPEAAGRNDSSSAEDRDNVMDSIKGKKLDLTEAVVFLLKNQETTNPKHLMQILKVLRYAVRSDT